MLPKVKEHIQSQGTSQFLSVVSLGAPGIADDLQNAALVPLYYLKQLPPVQPPNVWAACLCVLLNSGADVQQPKRRHLPVTFEDKPAGLV